MAYALIGLALGLLLGVLSFIVWGLLNAHFLEFIETKWGILYFYKGMSGISIRWISWYDLGLLRLRFNKSWVNLNPGGTEREFLIWLHQLKA